MYIPFEEINDNARIWIYQADRILNASAINEIEAAGINFVSEWTAHQETLHASFKIFHACFLVLAVDENVNDASGCSIDKSVHFIKQMEQRFNLNLFNRLNVGFMDDGKVNIMTIKQFTDLYNGHESKEGIKIFNNMISAKKDINNAWLVSVKDSWISGRLKQVV